MNIRVLGYALLAVSLILGAVFPSAQFTRPAIAGAGTAAQLTIVLPLDPGERSSGNAAAGNLTGNLAKPVLAFGTILSDHRKRIRVLHWQRDHYQAVWTFTNPYHDEGLVSLQIRNIRRFSADLVALWEAGSGHALGAQIFEWNGRTYREIWNLDKFVREGQFTILAWLQIRPILPSEFGLVIRAPIVKSYETRHDALPHQVSVYRWDGGQHTFTLFKRFVDPAKTFD